MTHKIETIKKKFPREWLLIAVDKIDQSTTTPVSGTLIFHSAYRDSAYRRLISLKRSRPILIEYSQDKMPKGFVAAF